VGFFEPKTSSCDFAACVESGKFRGMTDDSSDFGPHPSGEQSVVVETVAAAEVDVDSFAGSVRVEWDHEGPMTPHGQLVFFIDYLKTSGLFDALVADCPLRYASPNAPKKRDVLGTAMLSILAGAKRYAHIAALRGDGGLTRGCTLSSLHSACVGVVVTAELINAASRLARLGVSRFRTCIYRAEADRRGQA
jgi:hypothetical protein